VPHTALRQRKLDEDLLLRGLGSHTTKADFYRKELMQPGDWYIEEAFRYRGETATVWCVGDYLKLESVKKDMVRKFKSEAADYGKKRTKAHNERARSRRMDKVMEKLGAGKKEGVGVGASKKSVAKKGSVSKKR
jgi:hypothetical protein